MIAIVKRHLLYVVALMFFVSLNLALATQSVGQFPEDSGSGGGGGSPQYKRVCSSCDDPNPDCVICNGAICWHCGTACCS